MQTDKSGTSKPPHQILEERFANYIGTKYAVACSSGTAALHLALLSLGIGEGDEVICPDFNMVAGAFAVSYVRAKPVFADCDPDYNIDPSDIIAKITRRTKAIMVTHVYGVPADMPRIMEIASWYGLKVIEEAHGASIGGKRVGNWGDVGCFSFYKNKIIQCGEGGMITTNDMNVAKEAGDLKSMAFGDQHDYYHARIGYNYRLSDCQAQEALWNLGAIEVALARRRAIADGFGYEQPHGSVVWVIPFLAKSSIHKIRAILALGKNGISYRHFFKPMRSLPMWSEYAQTKASDYSDRGFYLPIDLNWTPEEIYKIKETICGNI